MYLSKRSTVYNNITSPEKIAKINPDNISLMNDFLEYLHSVDRAATTIKQYEANIKVFFCWNLEHNQNKFFVDLTKRNIAKFQAHALNEWHWSPKRIRTVKATLSSLSNFVENILDDEYEGYKPIVNKIESPENITVREKSVFSEDELQRLLDYYANKDDWYNTQKACLLALAMYSGRRKAELPRFKVSYFADENLICEGALYKTPEQVTTKGRGSHGKMLDLYTLAKPFKPYLDKWLSARAELGINSEWLFPKINRDGVCVDGNVQLDTSTIDFWFQGFSNVLKNELGIDKIIYPHACRHAFTTSLLKQGLPETIVQQLQGWCNSEVLRIYDDRETSELLEQYFDTNGIKQVEQKSLNDL